MAASARASMRLLSRQLALARLPARAYASRVGTHSYVAAGSVRAARSLGSVTSIPQRAIHTTSGSTRGFLSLFLASALLGDDSVNVL